MYLSRSLDDRRGTTDDLATSALQPSRSFVFLTVSLTSKHVHSWMLSSHLFFCLPRFQPPCTGPCKIALGSPDDRETWSHHFSFLIFTVARRSSCGPVVCLILFRTSSLVTWYLYVIPRIFLKHLISVACILFSRSAVSVHDSHAYRNMEMTGRASV